MSAGASAATVEYANFNSTAGLQLNGSAAQVGGALRLTPSAGNQSGSAFSTSTIGLNNLSTFSTKFQFQITEPGGGIDPADQQQGADGIVFVLQTVASNVGGGGGGIGYQGIPQSVGVEFDTWANVQDDGSGNHVGINTLGNIDSIIQTPITPLFNDGSIWTAWIDYNGSALEVRVNQTGIRPAQPTLATNLDLGAILQSPNAYVGFTSGTGGSYNNHDILNWTFEDTYRPIDTEGGNSVPDGGATVVLLGSTLLGMAQLRRRLRA